jgi:starch phosphorylase
METPATAAVAIALASERTDTSVDSIKQAFLNNLFFVQGKPVALATRHDYYMALAHLVQLIAC